MRTVIAKGNCLFCICLFVAAVSAQTPHPALTKEQWRQDLQYLAQELPRRHKNAFHTVSKEQFERAVAALDAAIPSLAEYEILVALRRIVAMIGDAHTALEPPENFHRYPLTLYRFGNDVRVIRTTANYKAALGARVVGVGSLGIAEASAKVDALTPHENDQFVRFRGISMMQLAEVLHALKIVPDLQHAQWTFENASGERFSLQLEAIPQDEKVEWLSSLKAVPLYRERLDELMWFKQLPESQTVYLNLRVYPDAATFKRVAEEFWKEVDRSQPRRLIIDVRQSFGGDFIKFQTHLLKELKRRSAFQRPGSLYVIIGRSTVSAAMVNAIELRKDLNAILVGEPTGSKPNNYSENDQLTLPNSRLEVSFSTRYYKLQDQDTQSVMPDKLIEPSWETYPSGRDPVMEWILAQPLGK
ncbi:MAG: hypothetical protein QOD75_3992 [Blastocatellia bacterium]|jgi:hypothetical protein|nr:hypothetical protein [Blastocatellia bacterium]